MNRETALEYVRPYLKEQRYEHTVRVVDTAVELAERFGADVKKAEIAAALHDYAKYKPLEEMKRWIHNDRRLPKDLLDYHHELWHGPVGALMLERELGLTDQEVLSAIAFHTTGKVHMGVLDKVVFLADYIEPGRSFPGVDEVRSTAEADLDRACAMALKNTITFLISKERTVYPDTFHAYNDMI
ncbi:bis(5'-nucleosyl)-tetraphosphatase (symmetrical) YqeK [Halobacillus yeomjeoni]|uniref:bis(5'-nucleosyl)-tetraphosphatase (symmetrical) n=1 Tax=Halobacillus yeomjeoni TaxID=311194 RepID=A0A931HUI8_9BACI|nr:bis(5'-nucleosyl)-tetraphosphatase (symmetrical) YqeK [Halobacillus yeomjeoni]MBH0229942.1 bis(5'-nucleosyl)-tetraphosphatase (symmetrical) YqeK [Halobacillus yeomjeoni]MCA0982680.1 bis(5'-nucleosyl)-tetraphosphatase (symmetrical) YqeK [Halobacillus yeomjeoni]